MFFLFFSLSLVFDWLLFLFRMKMFGDFSLLSLSLFDLRLQEIFKLVQSIFFFEVGDEDQELEDMDVFFVSFIDFQGVIFSLILLIFRVVDVVNM